MIAGIWSLGFGEVMAPLFFWIPLFFAATLVIDLFVVRWCRKRLRASGRATGLATLLLVVPLCVAGPIFAGCQAVPFSLQRSAGRLIERGGHGLAAAAASLGEKPARALLGVRGDDDLVNLHDARIKLKTSIAASLETEERGAMAVVKHLPELLERAYLGAVDVASYTFPLEREVKWRELAERARTPLASAGARLGGLQRYADYCYSGARGVLYVLIVLIAFANGLAMLIVHLVARRRAAGGPGEQAKAA